MYKCDNCGKTDSVGDKWCSGKFETMSKVCNQTLISTINNSEKLHFCSYHCLIEFINNNVKSKVNL